MSGQEMIDDIDEAVGVGGARGGADLSAWEEDFFASIKEQIMEGRALTPKQLEKLTEIWNRI